MGVAASRAPATKHDISSPDPEIHIKRLLQLPSPTCTQMTAPAAAAGAQGAAHGQGAVAMSVDRRGRGASTEGGRQRDVGFPSK